MEYVEACDDVEPLELPPSPPDDANVGFQGEKETKILVILEQDTNKNLLILSLIFSTIYLSLHISRRGSNSRDWSLKRLGK
jgi:hypothetical protein